MLQIKIDRARDALPKATRKAIDSIDWRAFILSLREKKGYSFEQLENLELETELLLCGLLDPRDYPKTLEEELKLPKAQIDLLVEEMNKAVFEKIKNELVKNTEKESVFIKKDVSSIPKDIEITKQPNEKLIEEIDSHAISPNVIKIEDTQISKNPSYGVQRGSSAVLSNETRIELMPEELEAPEEVKATIKEQEKILPKKAELENEPLKQENKIREPADSLFSQKLSGSFKLPSIKTDYSSVIDKNNNKNTPTINTKTLKSDPYRIDPNE